MSFYGEGSEALEIESERGWDPRTGAYVIRRWRGTPDGLSTVETELTLLGIRYDVSQEDEQGYHMLRAYYGASSTQSPTEALGDIWTLQGNDSDITMWQHPKILPELDKITLPEEKALFRK